MEPTHQTTSCSHCRQPLYIDRIRLDSVQWQCPACGAANAGANAGRSSAYVSPARQVLAAQRRASVV